jgi:hypothetical protein
MKSLKFVLKYAIVTVIFIICIMYLIGNYKQIETSMITNVNFFLKQGGFWRIYSNHI